MNQSKLDVFLEQVFIKDRPCLLNRWFYPAAVLWTFNTMGPSLVLDERPECLLKALGTEEVLALFQIVDLVNGIGAIANAAIK